jgi:hypothetical protein
MSQPGTALERPPAPDREQVLAILKLNPRDPAVQALVLTCERYDLDPLLKHAVLIDGRLYVTRDGLLHVAHRSQQFDGLEVVEGPDLRETHWVAKVSAYRKDMGRPFTYVGRFPKMRKRKAGDKWITEEHPYGPEMAVKCAEVMALRRAFDVALAAREEMWDQPDVIETVENEASESEPSEYRHARTTEHADSDSEEVPVEATDSAGQEGAPVSTGETQPAPSPPTRERIEDEPASAPATEAEWAAALEQGVSASKAKALAKGLGIKVGSASELTGDQLAQVLEHSKG